MKKFILCIITGISLFSSSLLASEQTFTINNSLDNFASSQKISEQINVLNQLVDDIYTDGIVFSYDGSKTTVDSYGINYFILNNVSILLKKEIYDKYRRYHSINDSKVLFNEVIKQYGDYWIFLTDSKDCCQGKLKIYIELLDIDNNIISRHTVRVMDTANNSGGGLTFSGFFDTIDILEGRKLAAKDISLLETDFNSLAGDVYFKLPIDDIKRIKYVKFRVVKIL